MWAWHDPSFINLPYATSLYIDARELALHKQFKQALTQDFQEQPEPRRADLPSKGSAACGKPHWLPDRKRRLI